MPRRSKAIGVSAGRHSHSPSSPPKIAALLDLSKPGERRTHDYLLRASTGRGRIWRLLDMRRKDPSLFVAVEWVRVQKGDRFGVVRLTLDGLAVYPLDYPTEAAARAALAAIADNPDPSGTPAAPAAAEGGAS